MTISARNARFKGSFLGDKTAEEFSRSFDAIASTTAERVVRIILSVTRKKSGEYLIGGDAKVLDLLQKLLPAQDSDFLN